MTKDYAALEAELHKLVERWRKTSAQARDAGLSLENAPARGHMQGLSDTFRVAADDLESLLADFHALK